MDEHKSVWRTVGFLAVLLVGFDISAAEKVCVYRRFNVIEDGGKVDEIVPIVSDEVQQGVSGRSARPKWAADVSQDNYSWSSVEPNTPYFKEPICFVKPAGGLTGTPLLIDVSQGTAEPFYRWHHNPDITWLENGDLLAVWYSCGREKGTELTVLASRLRQGEAKWDYASEFFKAQKRNMHGNSIFYDEKSGTLHHINGMGREGISYYFENISMLYRRSEDNGVSWSVAKPICEGANYQDKNLVHSKMIRLRDGTLIQPSESFVNNKSFINISRDNGLTWQRAAAEFYGVHPGVVELNNGNLFAFSRGVVDGRMPMSVSDDLGESWQTSPSEFPPIGGGQRLVLMRLREGHLMLVSFTCRIRENVPREGMEFTDSEAEKFTGYGMYAAVSYDEGESWACRKLITPGNGEYTHFRGVMDTTPTQAENAGYLAATQTPDRVIHLVSSKFHYRFNLKRLETPPVN